MIAFLDESVRRGGWGSTIRETRVSVARPYTALLRHRFMSFLSRRQAVRRCRRGPGQWDLWLPPRDSGAAQARWTVCSDGDEMACQIPCTIRNRCESRSAVPRRGSGLASVRIRNAVDGERTAPGELYCVVTQLWTLGERSTWHARTQELSDAQGGGAVASRSRSSASLLSSPCRSPHLRPCHRRRTPS